MTSRHPHRQPVSRVCERLETRTLLSAGSPDVSYGVNSVVAGPAFDKSHTLSGGYEAIVVQSDRRVIVGDTVSVKNRDVFYLRRFNACGGIDKSFGSGGVAEITLPSRDLLLTGIVLQPDGKIIVTGTADARHDSSGIDTTITDEIVARLNTTGKPDTSFGQLGILQIAVANGPAQSLATKITATVQNSNFIVASPTTISRVTSTGQIDPTFAPVTNTKLPTTADFVSVAVDTNGEILAGLDSGAGVARFTSDGLLDATFGSAGVFSDSNLPIDHVTQILPRGDGSIVLVTSHDDGTSRGDHLIGLTGTGTLDSNFTNAGIAATLPDADDGYPAVSITQEFDGKLLLVSPTIPFAESSTPNGFVVQRFSPQGLPDDTFGDDGIATFDGSVVAGRPAGAALDPAGRLIVSAGNATLIAVDTTGAGGNLTGTIFDDHTANKILNTTDTGIAAATVFIDYNKDGKFDGADFRVTADANGHFTFPTIPAGQYEIRVDPIAGYTPTTKTVLLFNVKNNVTASNINFGELKLGAAAGTVSAEGVALSGITVFLDLNHNGRFNPAIDRAATTDSGGNFSFANLPRGKYQIVQVLPAGYRRTAPTKGNALSFKLASEQNLTGLSFSNTLIG